MKKRRELLAELENLEKLERVLQRFLVLKEHERLVRCDERIKQSAAAKMRAKRVLKVLPFGGPRTNISKSVFKCVGHGKLSQRLLKRFRVLNHEPARFEKLRSVSLGNAQKYRADMERFPHDGHRLRSVEHE